MAKHIHQQTNFTAEDRQRHKAIRERFQREKPSLESLVASGEYTPSMPHGVYLDMLCLLGSLRRVREAVGLSLTDMAQRTGMDKAALSRLETGQQGNPTLETVYRYAAALGKRLVWRFEDDAGAAEKEPAHSE